MVETRKLAAILAADVVGFSRMTRADEDGTLERLRTLRSELIDPTVSANKGRVFKRTGDGVLVEFRSVVDAVRCALDVQKAMIARNASEPHARAARTARSDDPTYLAQLEPIFEGMRKAGLPEQ